MSTLTENENWIYGTKSTDPLLHAFPERHTIDPRFDVKKAKISGDNITADELLKLLKIQSPGYQAAYFHIPFCITRCSFCRFFQHFAHDQSPVDIYVNHLIKDIELTARSLEGNIKPINALYFGGGTPTMLSAENISDLFKSIRTFLPLANDCEITFEARTIDIEKGKISACLDNGVNRFSFGVQSFDTQVRKLMSRFLPREEIIRQLSELTAKNLATISIDLIYGLPNQNEDVWIQDLDGMLKTQVDGVDTYQLEDTMLRIRFGKNFGKLEMPTIVEKAKMSRIATVLFESNGYHRKNNTHWARDNRERNLYTSLTRSGVRVPQNDILAFGSGAIGKAGDNKYQLTRDLEDYLLKTQNSKKPVEYIETPGEDLFIDELVSQIDTGQINLDLFIKDYGTDLEHRFEKLMDAYVENRLIQIDGRIIKLTEAGRFWKSNIALGFILSRNIQD